MTEETQSDKKQKKPGFKSRPRPHLQGMYPEKTRADAIMEWGQKGKQLQKQQSLEYWRSLEAQLPITTREKIFKVTLDLQKRVDRQLLQKRVATGYVHYLVRTALLVHGKLDDVKAVSLVLADPRFQGQLRNFLAAYNHYRRVHNINEELTVKRDRRRKLPILTPESTLKASIPIPRQLRWQAYFRLRYETGPRPSEPFHMQKQDLNFDRELVRFKTLKGSGETLERELPISPLLCEQLRTLTAEKHREDFVFTKPLIPWKPLDYKDAQGVMDRVRKQLKQAGYPTRGLCLYVYRHAFLRFI